MKTTLRDNSIVLRTISTVGLLLLGSFLICACQAALPSPTPSTTPTPESTPIRVQKKATPAARKQQNIKPTTQSTEVPAIEEDPIVILGRPEATQISLSLFSANGKTVTIRYQSEDGKSSGSSPFIQLGARVPKIVTLSELLPDTSYLYEIVEAGMTISSHRFHTQRPIGSSFTFTIDADPHNRDPRFDQALYLTTLSNALKDQPDFHINLGDTFMTEKGTPASYEEAASTFTDMLPYFGTLNADTPLFLVNGNHEGELGWLLNRGKSPNLPIWSTQLRQAYFPVPSADGFYSGSLTPDPALDSPRDSYYAWSWGDALFIVLDPFWYTLDKPKTESNPDNWYWTLGADQYDWLKHTLEDSQAPYKFVFIHNLVGGLELEGSARGGIETADLFEWGGSNLDGTDGFAMNRPGWAMPIHQLLVQNEVSVVFHGHDHLFAYQTLDGVVYQECPQPNVRDGNADTLSQAYHYFNGKILGSSGHIRVRVTPEKVTVEYIQAVLPDDEKPGKGNGSVAFSYDVFPAARSSHNP